MLRKAVQAFNKDADEETGCDYYCGRLPSTRRYLNRSFIETAWTKDSLRYKAILNTDIRLEDGTFVKGFPSLPADAKIVRLKLDRLPLKAPQRLRKDMENCLSEYGRVLDLGINRSHGCFTGQGYATLNLTQANANDPPFESLQRVIPWMYDDGEIHQVLLQWENMPDFCRLCQASDHCRADCPDLKNYMKCFNCNKKGHMMRQCPRS
ncbi:uncharacterized protein B0P05DRAFT_464631, partial [Gilbertella persicaria]|uniref:uncharacterized protein n=1 Tax=Gilbertella persicaria TaxID=101096 RepID=UPI002220CFC7